MAELFNNDSAILKRDVDVLQDEVSRLPKSTTGTVLSYTSLIQTGFVRLADGSTVQFKNWSGSELLENSKVLLITKDSVNYVVGTEQTLSGWASTQTIVNRPAAETVVSLRSEYVGNLITINNTTGEVQVPVTHDLVLSPGQSIDFLRKGGAEVRFLAAGTPTQIVTVSSTPGLRLRAQWSACTLMCIGLNQYVVIGDLKV